MALTVTVQPCSRICSNPRMGSQTSMMLEAAPCIIGNTMLVTSPVVWVTGDGPNCTSDFAVVEAEGQETGAAGHGVEGVQAALGPRRRPAAVHDDEGVVRAHTRAELRGSGIEGDVRHQRLQADRSRYGRSRVAHHHDGLEPGASD